MDLPKVKGVYKEDSKLAHLTWFKVGGNADILFKPLDEEDLADFLKQIDKKTPITIIGAGSNVIIRDKGIEGVVVKLANSFTEIETLPGGNLLVGAGCLNFNLAKYAQVNTIKGFEFLVGIPGTIGGGVAMNAGSYGAEFKDIVTSVHALDRNGNKMLFTGEDMGFGYRKNSLPEGYIFTKVEFLVNHGDEEEIKKRMQEISTARASTQPITEKTGGSTFANPATCRAWELIDKAGLRGAKIGGAMMSDKHCNFMINTGNASASDLENLGELVINRVKEKTGIELKWEIKRIGRK
ncbi:MAG: UDP-N-acetylmuramate dehydrogenase [Rickettsiales bacterium]|nr:UDP-N-acetylmuramate dehydrogenase [Rickettsiales bacterium]